MVGDRLCKSTSKARCSSARPCAHALASQEICTDKAWRAEPVDKPRSQPPLGGAIHSGPGTGTKGFFPPVAWGDLGADPVETSQG
jgi:hypothetical protein